MVERLVQQVLPGVRERVGSFAESLDMVTGIRLDFENFLVLCNAEGFDDYEIAIVNPDSSVGWDNDSMTRVKLSPDQLRKMFAGHRRN